MTEKRANEYLQQYVQAEIKGQNTDAERIEKFLNDNGWFIRTGPDGMVVQRRDREGTFPDVEDYLPKESNIQPYKGTVVKSNKNLWIGIGIAAGAIALTILIVYLVKRRQNANAS
ncbi:MAG: hypothetical protein A3D31_11330 [Candidatus Fluviicola riflensis]|nr:MAG: hypothetical protein CHH17_15755 [Candidatus Fluviicola riflensis]OGS77581.1 MAG: hypothetical protein A3D31_11330 [Candidatus Fluviicola riflensis]OGS84163.1 MAG: hypothetical protein A3E30_12735 [Fluviicola sp. RIFCSPHIGHO2_12_FULL_43_24]